MIKEYAPFIKLIQHTLVFIVAAEKKQKTKKQNSNKTLPLNLILFSHEFPFCFRQFDIFSYTFSWEAIFLFWFDRSRAHFVGELTLL